MLLFSTKNEKFRNTIVQAVFSTPGVSSPHEDITDEEIALAWKKIVGERAAFAKEAEDLKVSLKKSQAAKTELNQSVGVLQMQLDGAEVL